MHWIRLKAQLFALPALLFAAACTEEEAFPVERTSSLAELPKVGVEVVIEQTAAGLKLDVGVRYDGYAFVSDDRALGSRSSRYCPVLDDSFTFKIDDAILPPTTFGELEVNGLDEHFSCLHPRLTATVPAFLQKEHSTLTVSDDSKTMTVELGDRLMARTVERVGAAGWDVVRDEPFSVRFHPGSAVAGFGGVRLEAYVKEPYLMRQFVGVSRSLADATASFVYPNSAPVMSGFFRFPLQTPEASCGTQCRIQARYDVEQIVTVR